MYTRSCIDFVTNEERTINTSITCKLERRKLEACRYINFVANIVTGAERGAQCSNYHLVCLQEGEAACCSSETLWHCDSNTYSLCKTNP